MAQAQGSRSRLAWASEASFGATPSAPSMTSIPYKTHSLGLSKQRVQGQDLQFNRIPRVDRHGTRQIGGDINVDFRPDVYDWLLESALFNTFPGTGTAEIKNGTTPQFYTVEDGALDIGQYRVFSGLAVSQMSMSIAPNQLIETTFSLVGQDETSAQTELATPTAAAETQPFDSFTGEIKEGGSTIGIISSLNFSVQNSLAPTFVVGSRTASQLEFGRAVVEGQITAYYEDTTLLDKFINETNSSIEITLDGPASDGKYTILLPNVKYNGGDVPVENAQSRIITLPFVSIYDGTEQNNIKITKT